MKKTKEQRFERIVEWKEKPNYVGIVLSLLAIFSGVIILKELYNMPTNFVHFLIFVNSLITITVGFVVFMFMKGKKKEVHWRRIK